MTFKLLTPILGLCVFASAHAHAGEWKPVTGADTLRAFMSGVTLEWSGDKRGIARGEYRPDGTGTLFSWRAPLERTWEIEGDDRIRVTGQGVFKSYTLEQSTTDAERYRVMDTATGRSAVIRKVAATGSATVEGSPASAGNTGGAAAAEEAGDGRANPRLATDEVENQIALDREANPLYESKLLTPVRDWRDGVAEKTGLNMSLDYSAFAVTVSDSPGEEDAGSGMVRFFGFWDLVNRGEPNKGSLNWKIENRHRYTDIPASALGFESGYAGLFGAPFSNEGNRLTLLNWKQYFADGKAAAVAGFLDVTDYVDVYLLASPWLGFGNFAFSTGSAAMDLPNDAALGGAVGGMITEQVYVQAGIADANSDPTEPFDGFDSVADDSDFFKWVEIGLTPGQDTLYFDNLHLTYWHIDERVNGTPDGWGLNLSWHKWIADTWFPFARYGYTEDSGSLMENALAVGMGYQPVPQRGVIGAGFHWGEPNPVSFEGADDQYTGELFWRYQFTRELALTPSLQFIKDPALNPEEDDLWVFGLRARISI